MPPAPKFVMVLDMATWTITLARAVLFCPTRITSAGIGDGAASMTSTAAGSWPAFYAGQVGDGLKSGAGGLHAMNDIRPGPTFAGWPRAHGARRLHATNGERRQASYRSSTPVFSRTLRMAAARLSIATGKMSPHVPNAEAVFAGRIHAGCSPSQAPGRGSAAIILWRR